MWPHTGQTSDVVGVALFAVVGAAIDVIVLATKHVFLLLVRTIGVIIFVVVGALIDVIILATKRAFLLLARTIGVVIFVVVGAFINVIVLATKRGCFLLLVRTIGAIALTRFVLVRVRTIKIAIFRNGTITVTVLVAVALFCNGTVSVIIVFITIAFFCSGIADIIIVLVIVAPCCVGYISFVFLIVVTPCRVRNSLSVVSEVSLGSSSSQSNRFMAQVMVSSSSSSTVKMTSSSSMLTLIFRIRTIFHIGIALFCIRTPCVNILITIRIVHLIVIAPFHVVAVLVILIIAALFLIRAALFIIILITATLFSATANELHLFNPTGCGVVSSAHLAAIITHLRGHDVDVAVIVLCFLVRDRAFVDVVVAAAATALRWHLVGVACRGLKLGFGTTVAAVTSNNVFRVADREEGLEAKAVVAVALLRDHLGAVVVVAPEALAVAALPRRLRFDVFLAVIACDATLLGGAFGIVVVVVHAGGHR
ncbi:hypothetical protein EJB05_04218, partial [Eragrostis curvula]